MKTSPLFTPSTTEIDRLIARHPFAQLVSIHENAPISTPLPLLLEHRSNGDWLVGHFARANPQVALLRNAPRALAIFMGPQGYISPSWMRDRTQAPTWNYATVHMDVQVDLQEDTAAIDSALSKLVAHMEADRPSAWSAREMGERYARLATAVVAFEARVIATSAKFKLGQNERDDVFADIITGLRDNDQHALVSAMENPGARMRAAARNPP